MPQKSRVDSFFPCNLQPSGLLRQGRHAPLPPDAAEVLLSDSESRQAVDTRFRTDPPPLQGEDRGRSSHRLRARCKHLHCQASTLFVAQSSSRVALKRVAALAFQTVYIKIRLVLVRLLL